MSARTREIGLPPPEQEDYSDLPPLAEDALVMYQEDEQEEGLPSTLTGIMPTHQSAKPSVVAFECLNATDTNVPCIICMDVLHDETGEKIKLSKCCHCSIHLTCTYKWLANQYTRNVPRESWSCPHCRTPVKDLANNPLPCMLCHNKELDGKLYYEPIAQSTPCCEAAIHQQCLYDYINFQTTLNFSEKRFPCPSCATILSANRTVALHMNTGQMNVAEMNLAGVQTNMDDADAAVLVVPQNTPTASPATPRRNPPRRSRPMFPRRQPIHRSPDIPPARTTSGEASTLLHHSVQSRRLSDSANNNNMSHSHVQFTTQPMSSLRESVRNVLRGPRRNLRTLLEEE